MRGLLETIVRLWALLGGCVLLAIVLVTSVNVGGFLADRIAALWGGTVSGLPGYEDFVALAVSVAALTFFPYCQLRRGHVFVELFTSAAPAAVRRWLDRFWLAATVGLALFLAYWMWFGMWERQADGAVSRVLGWPQWPFFLPGIVSLLLWAAVAAAQISETEASGHGGENRDG